ncbi:NAD(P)-binding protein [Sarocladium strictum]
MHLAAPYNLILTNNEVDVLIPAIKGTESILKSVDAHGTAVKRVILTSSFSAIYDPTKGLNPGHVYTEDDWSPITYDIARDGDGYTAYFGAKTLAEKAAWDFVRQLSSPPKFDITVLNPPIVMGPSAKPLNFAALGTSMGDINRLIDGSSTEVPGPSFWPFVDVRDVATGHVRALESPSTAGQRILLASSMFSFQQVCDILHKSDRIGEEDKAKIPVGKPGQDYPGPHTYTVDVSKSQKLLGLEYRTLEETVVDAALSIIQSRNSQ